MAAVGGAQGSNAAGTGVGMMRAGCRRGGIGIGNWVDSAGSDV